MSGNQPLYTLGHSNLTLDDFIALLNQYGVKCVIDVRSSPYSRYVHWFNREDFRKALQAAGFRYVYGGSVLGGRAPYKLDDELFRSKLDRAVEVHSETPALMMCAEKNPQECHRAFKLIHALHTQHPDLEIVHILGKKEGTIDSREFAAKQKDNWAFK